MLTKMYPGTSQASLRLFSSLSQTLISIVPLHAPPWIKIFQFLSFLFTWSSRFKMAFRKFINKRSISLLPLTSALPSLPRPVKSFRSTRTLPPLRSTIKNMRSKMYNGEACRHGLWNTKVTRCPSSQPTIGWLIPYSEINKSLFYRLRYL